MCNLKLCTKFYTETVRILNITAEYLCCPINRFKVLPSKMLFFFFFLTSNAHFLSLKPPRGKWVASKREYRKDRTFPDNYDGTSNARLSDKTIGRSFDSRESLQDHRDVNLQLRWVPASTLETRTSSNSGVEASQLDRVFLLALPLTSPSNSSMDRKIYYSEKNYFLR